MNNQETEIAKTAHSKLTDNLTKSNLKRSFSSEKLAKLEKHDEDKSPTVIASGAGNFNDKKAGANSHEVIFMPPSATPQHPYFRVRPGGVHIRNAGRLPMQPQRIGTIRFIRGKPIRRMIASHDAS